MNDMVSHGAADESSRHAPQSHQIGPCELPGELPGNATPTAAAETGVWELDESAILQEETDAEFFAELDVRPVEKDYDLRPEDDRQTLAAAITASALNAAHLQTSYYESCWQPLDASTSKPLELQEPSTAASQESPRKTLPLPDLDRELIEGRLRRQTLRRLSLSELFGFTTFVAVILAAASWLPLNWYTLLLGCVTFGLLLVNLRHRQTERRSWIALVTLLLIYVGSIVITCIRMAS